MNFYFVVGILGFKKLRVLQYYPIWLQCAVDLFGSGFGGLFTYMATIYGTESRYAESTFEQKAFPIFLSSRVKRFYLKLINEEMGAYFWMDCFPLILFLRVPEYFTGLITLALALERYILIVKPFRASELLTKRNRVISYSILTLTGITFSVLDVTVRLPRYAIGEYQIQRCFSGPFGTTDESKAISMLVLTLFFYAIPAVGSLGLYFQVIRVLSKKKTNVSRNRVLTAALFASCVCWVLTWAITILCRLAYRSAFKSPMYKFMEDVLNCLLSRNYQFGIAYLLDFISTFSQFFHVFGAVLSPFCLLIVCKIFWEPIKALERNFYRF